MDLAKYACRDSFLTDIQRIVYSNAFRRLANKSQVIVGPTHDHLRSRLTHTLEVEQIALAIATPLRLNLQLVSAIAKAHDLGHTPFGHAGERTIQRIILQEFKSAFPVRINDKVPPPRERFHHSTNSARILIRKIGGISDEVVRGVITHSWSPWSGTKSSRSIPRTYEAQVAAIADQIASINHDTEDIVSASSYTGYDYSKFRARLVEHLRSRPEASDDQWKEKLDCFLDERGEGFGRESRISYVVKEVVNNAREHFDSLTDSACEMPARSPLQLTAQWAAFLREYENFIRNIISTSSWIVGRDAMADAFISATFAYLWTGSAKGQYAPSSNCARNYDAFRQDEYSSGGYDKYLSQCAGRNLPIWDLNLSETLSNPYSVDEESVRFVSVIDYVAGLTDRYCSEIFTELYQHFIPS